MNIEISIRPRTEVLRTMGVSEAEFDAALECALEALDECPDSELPVPEDMRITLSGRAYRLGEVATVVVSSNADPDNTKR